MSLTEHSLPLEGNRQLSQALEDAHTAEAVCALASTMLCTALPIGKAEFIVKETPASAWQYACLDEPLPPELESRLEEAKTFFTEEGTIHVAPLEINPPLQASLLLYRSEDPEILHSPQLLGLLAAITPHLSEALLAHSFERQGKLILQFTRKLTALQQVNLVINNSYELNELSSAICSITTQAMGAQYAGLYYFEKDGLRMIEDLAVFKPKGLSLLKMLQDANKSSKKEVIPMEKAGFLGEAAKTGKQIAIADLGSHLEVCPEALMEHNLVSVIATPLATQREILGVLLVGTNAPRDFTPSEVELMADIARQTTGAFITSKLYQETVEEKQRADRMVEQLKVLNEATAEVGKTLDVDATCRELLKHLDRFVTVNWAGIYLLQGTAYSYTHGTAPLLESPPDPWLQALRMANYPKSLTVAPELLMNTPLESAPQVTLLPLLASSQLFGLLILSSETTDATQLDLVNTLVAHTALAINNALMHTQVEQQAITDALTNVYNRRYFNDRLRMELHRSDRYHHPVSLLILDIDFFKKCNDVLGHLGGDTVLKELSALLREKVRSVDIVARYGGEEFAVILPETPTESAYYVCEKIRAFIEEFPFTDQERLPHRNITASLGVATYPTHAKTLEELIKVADDALYCAKQGGRNRTCTAEDPS